MPKRNSIWQFASRHRIVSIVAGQIVVLAALALLLLGTGFLTNASSVFAASCTSSDTTSILVDQHACIPASVAVLKPQTVNGSNALVVARGSKGAKGRSNNFPYGQCTWWADQRYHQLTGAYVPWTSNADAYQWAGEASHYHWKVSNTPKRGSIMMLSVGVEGAFGDGHVAVVERLLGGGRFMVSEMNWGGRTGVVTYSTFTAARGVYFISIN